MEVFQITSRATVAAFLPLSLVLCFAPAFVQQPQEDREGGPFFQGVSLGEQVEKGDCGTESISGSSSSFSPSFLDTPGALAMEAHE